MTTYSAKAEEIKRDWVLVDAQGQRLGRLASDIAMKLMGKHKPQYTRHVDTGDYIVVVNAEKVELTGNKANEKIHWHTGYPGGIKSTTRKDILEGRFPERALMKAVRGMLPSTKLGRAMLKKLKIYAGPHHPHQAQLADSAAVAG